MLLHLSIYSPGAELKIQSYDLASANYLGGILQNMYQYLDIPEKPQFRRNSAGELSFYPPHNGRITTESGRKSETGRAFQLRAFHGSELAFWDNPESSMLGVASALSDTDPNSISVFESTANGVGGYFWQKYQDAKEGKAGGYRSIFLPWWKFDDYRMDHPDSFSEKDLSDKEQEIMHSYGLGLDRMFWYQWVLREKCEGREDLRAQEYPSNDEEAFLASGRCRFKSTTLVNLPISESHVDGNLSYEIGNSGRIEKARFDPVEGGYLRVWEKPQKDTPYVIGVDVSEGTGDDDSALIVLNANNYYQAAEILGRFEPDEELGLIVYMLGMMYNKAFIGVEINGPGFSTQSRLLSLGYPQGRMYTQQDVLQGTARIVQKRFGWRTTALTREMAINRFASAIDSGDIGVRSERWFSQLKTFVGKQKGHGIKYEAQQGCHDDLVMAGAIASVLLADPRSHGITKKFTGFGEDDEDHPSPKKERRTVNWGGFD
jgi:hypothetical protein